MRRIGSMLKFTVTCLAGIQRLHELALVDKGLCPVEIYNQGPSLGSLILNSKKESLLSDTFGTFLYVTGLKLKGCEQNKGVW